MNPDLIPWRAKKLADDSFAYLVPDADIKADGGKMCVKVIVSTETMDRERDILVAKGCEFRDHKANPIVLLNHRKDWPGIAQSEDPDGNYTVKALDDRIEAVNYFNQSSKLALQSFRLVESGALRGVSPGFLTVPGHIRKFKAHDGQPAFIYDRWNLVEITHCPIPMNPEALVLAVEKGFGGESLEPQLKELLLPFVPAKKAIVVSGFEERDAGFSTSKSYGEVAADVIDAEIDLSDADPPMLTPSTAYYQAVHEKAFDLLGMVQELNGTQELDSTKLAGREIIALVGGVVNICKQKHAEHILQYPDQPGLPDNINGDLASKKMSEWRVKAMEAWDTFKREQSVAVENSADIRDAVEFCRILASDLTLRTSLRGRAKALIGRLSNVKMVQVEQDDEEAVWGQVAEKLAQAKVA